jgi:pimeloyl-ACP methyl ester carboxylesterase
MAMLWKWTRRITFYSFCLIAALLLGGAALQWIYTQQDLRRFPPTGQMVDIGGYKLHLHTTGSGGPAVILDSGLGCISSDWGLVQSQLEKWTQVVSYDRAGTGWSEPSPHPRTSQHIVYELHTLLENAHIPKPYILVGHSFGGNNVQLYATCYPDEVLGLVLVDSCHPEQELQLPRNQLLERQLKIAKCPKVIYFISTCGISRLLSPKYLNVMMPFLPEAMQQRHLALCSTTKHDCTVAQEAAALSTSLQQLHKANFSLIKNKPCFVLSAGRIPDMSKYGLSQAFVHEMHTAWSRLQHDLASKFNHSSHLIAEKSDHMIPWHQPELISNAVHSLDQINTKD